MSLSEFCWFCSWWPKSVEEQVDNQIASMCIKPYKMLGFDCKKQACCVHGILKKLLKSDF